MVRKKLMDMAKDQEGYFDVEAFGVPINDQDTVATISTFSAQLIWIALPAQGIFMRKDEIEDYVALWRLVAYYMGTPDKPLRTSEATKACMESILDVDLRPSHSGKVLASNIISSLADKAPTYPSADYLRAQARWLNGPLLSDALEIPKPSYLSTALVLVQCLVICTSCYTYRSIPFLDRWKINYLRKYFQKGFVESKYGLQGKKTRFEMQYIPGYSTVAEQGEARNGLALANAGSQDMKNLIRLIVLVGVLVGIVYFWVKVTIVLWNWIR
jgi:hypothetical protein